MKWRREIVGAMVGGVLVAAAVLTWKAYYSRTETAVGASALASMQALNRLTVFTAVLSTAATTTDPGFHGWLSARQTLIASGRVDYSVEFTGMTKSDLSWDQAKKNLTVHVSDPHPTRANIDMTRAQLYQAGELVTMFKGSGQDLGKKNYAAIYSRFDQDARGPTFMRLAREAARVAITNNFKLPLQAAGIPANVVVRFAGEQN